MSEPALSLDVPAVVATAGRFSVIGALCALLNVAIVYVGHDLLRWPYLNAAAMTSVITIPLSYAAHSRFSFRQRAAAGWAVFGRFLAQQLSQFLLGMLLLAALVQGLDLAPVLGMAAVAAIMWIYGFITNASWVFRAFGSRG